MKSASNKFWDNIGEVFYHKEKQIILDFTSPEKARIYVNQILFNEMDCEDPSFDAWLDSAVEHAKDRFLFSTR